MMQKYRRAAKVDVNQNEIVRQLRRIPGVTVELSHDDILVGYKGETRWYEIKSPDAVSKKTGLINESFLKPSQIKLLNSYTGHYRVITMVDEILDDLNIK